LVFATPAVGRGCHVAALRAKDFREDPNIATSKLALRANEPKAQLQNSRFGLRLVFIDNPKS
jgi:hypothetical protein